MNELPELVIVDDEQRVTRSLERELRLELDDTVCAIQCFTDPVAALEYVRDRMQSVFLVISDLRMPQMNGDLLLEKIRSTNPDAQTILLTAYTDLDSIQRAVASSIQALLFKPWSGDELLSCVRKALSIWKLKRENALLRQRMDSLLRDAGEFQQRLFSSSIHQSDGIEFGVFFQPHEAYHCGGDFYEIREAAPGRFLLLVGDVSGHGPKPAMIAGMVKTILAMSLQDGSAQSTNPGEVLSRLNASFCALLGASPETLISIAAVEIIEATMTLNIATAGIPPVLLASGDRAELIATLGSALGTDPLAEYRTVKREAHPGDQLAVFTDGVVESITDNYSMSTEAMCRVMSSFARDEGTQNEHGSAAAARLAARLQDKLPEQKFTDDATLVLVSFASKA